MHSNITPETLRYNHLRHCGNLTTKGVQSCLCTGEALRRHFTLAFTMPMTSGKNKSVMKAKALHLLPTALLKNLQCPVILVEPQGCCL